MKESVIHDLLFVNATCVKHGILPGQMATLLAQKSVDVNGRALNKAVLKAAIASVHTAISHNYDALMRLRYAN